MNENLFLLYNHYGIKETFTDSQIIFHAVNRSYRDFWRQIHFHGKNVFNQDTKNEYKSEFFLSENLPRLFESETQQDFDKTHYALCNTLIHMYDGICKWSYGIAQRLINQTLVHLIVIEILGYQFCKKIFPCTCRNIYVTNGYCLRKRYLQTCITFKMCTS